MKLGNHVSVISRGRIAKDFGKLNNSGEGSVSLIPTPNFMRFVGKIGMARPIFLLQLFVTSCFVRRQEKRNSVIWTRSAHSLMFVRRHGCPIVLEVHHPLSAAEQMIVKVVARRRRLTLVFNSRRQLTHSSPTLKGCRRVVAYAAIKDDGSAEGDDSVRAVFGDRSDLVELLYVGRFESMGTSKGVELVFEVAISHDFPKNVRLTILGGSNDEVELLRSKGKNLGIDDQRLRFIPSVPNSSVLQLMRRADVLLAIYSNESSDSLTSEGPRKIFEYRESGVPIIASATANVTELLANDEALLFEPGSASDLVKKIRIFSETGWVPRPIAFQNWTPAQRMKFILEQSV